MKHFIVRCCQYPSQLKDPDSILVYLLSGALGFATFENIEYVFGTKASPVQGTTLLVGELVVLLFRVLLPIHVICSVLQASQLSKVMMGDAPNSLFMILLPAITLHGSFDFFLFVIGILSSAGYNNNSSAGVSFVVLSITVPFVMAIAGTIWAYRSFGAVSRKYDAGWQQVAGVGNGDNNL